MRIRNSIRTIRSNYFISMVLIFIFKPVYNFSLNLCRWIPKYIRPNSRELFYHGIQIRFPKNTGGSILNKIFWAANNFESEIGKVIKVLSAYHSVFIDIGCNIGFYAILAKKVNSKIVVHCIEPIPFLAKKIELMGNENNIFDLQIHQIGISSSSEIKKIFLPNLDEYRETTTASLNHDFFYNRKQIGTYLDINTKTLDDFTSNLNLAKMEKSVFLKIDVEGHEVEVLKSGLDFINQYNPIIILEMEQKTENIFNFFKLDFLKCYRIYKIIPNYLCLTQIGDFCDNDSADNFLLVPSKLMISERNLIKISEFESWIKSGIKY